MQYKQKRYSNALYPRQYQKGADFTHETLGVGQVYRTTCSKSPSKEKYWNYYVRFNRPEGECIEEVFEIQATTTIVLFPKSVEPLQPIQFPLAPFNTNGELWKPRDNFSWTPPKRPIFTERTE